MNICIALVHGIGRQNDEYADRFIDRVKRLYTETCGQHNLVFEAVCWQDEIEYVEDDLLRKYYDMPWKGQKALGWWDLREFFIRYAGDAICYQPIGDSSAYNRIHAVMDQSFSKLYNASPDSPLVVISHSLGSIVASNFIWDCQHGKNSLESRQMVDKMELLYTMGSPLSVWSLAYEDGGVPIDIPDFSKWYNLYSPYDILSYPLKPVNSRYGEMANLHDKRMLVGGLLGKFTPASHIAYWDSKSVIRHVVNKLCQIEDFFEKAEKIERKDNDSLL